jgi:hypothetical protein
MNRSNLAPAFAAGRLMSTSADAVHPPHPSNPGGRWLLAAEAFAGGGKGIKIEIVYADHQNKADIARRSHATMAFLASSTASTDLTGKGCSPNTIQWVIDTWVTGNTTAAATARCRAATTPAFTPRRSVVATGSDDAKEVVPRMKTFSGNDKLFGDVTIRPDGGA